MAKIAINLLPLEFGALSVKEAKFRKVQAIGFATILLMVFLASLTVFLRILQSQNITQVQNKLTASEQKISNLKNTQASLLLLKNRLTTINQYFGVPSKQAEMYKLITTLLPASVSVSSISVEKTGEVLILAIAPDGDSLNTLITNLTTEESNQDKIAQVSLEGINRGRDGIYRISMKIKSKI